MKIKRIRKNRSYRHKMFLYSLLSIIIILFIMMLYINLNRTLIEKYNQSYLVYRKLNDFYDVQDKAHASFKNYLYTQSKQEFSDYEHLIDEAANDIREIQKFINADDALWRFNLLDNMMKSYTEQAQNVMLFMTIKDKEYGTAYDNLLKINETIKQTSDDYYRIVTEVMENTRNEIDTDKKNIELLSIGIVFVSVCAILVYAITIQKSITNPIDNLVDNMEDIKAGTFDLNHIHTNSKEIEVLCIALQDLSDNIHKNIENEKEKASLQNRLLLKENENLRKDELLASSELKILQSQINPHFLFNAMNMIYQQAIAEHSSITIELIEKMTECMRYTMSQNSRTSTLHMELNFVKNYIYIQNKRFEGRIRFELEIEHDVPNIKIPAMIIEPLIDNSVKHGLANTTVDGLVTIDVSCDNEKITIRVSDNGKGMDTDKLENLIMNEYKAGYHDDNLGLYNLSRRLDMFFSKMATISTTSFEDCGFDTLITLPIEKGRETKG